MDGVNRYRRKTAVSLLSCLCEDMIRVVEVGRPVIGFGLHGSPRGIAHREMAISKVVPRITYIRPWSLFKLRGLFYFL